MKKVIRITESELKSIIERQLLQESVHSRYTYALSVVYDTLLNADKGSIDVSEEDLKKIEHLIEEFDKDVREILNNKGLIGFN